MSFRARTFKVNFRCSVDAEVYSGFNIALCVHGKHPSENPIQQLYIKPPHNPSGWYEYTFFDFFLDDQKIYDVFVQAVAFNTDSFWRSVGGIEIPDDGVGTIGDKPPSGPPSNVQGFHYTIVETGVILEWAPAYETDLSHFIVKSGSAWSSPDVVYTGKNTSHMLPMLKDGSYTFLIKSVDVDKKESTDFASLSFTIKKPAAPALAAAVVGDSIELSWNSPESTFPIVEYELKKNGIPLGRIKSTVFTLKAPAAGQYNFTVQAINAVNEAGIIGSTDVEILAPGASTVFPQVIDNNVLLRWSKPSTGSLPISHYEARKGDSYATAVPIGKIDSIFTTIFESAAGQYTYWITAYDTAGNPGEPASCRATVDQPPDFVLYSEIESSLGGSIASVFKTHWGTLVAPVNTTESWAQHFTANSVTTPQQQIAKGQEYYLEPSKTSATYVEEIDYGVVIGGTKISITPTYAILHGSVNVTCKIEVRATTSDSWINLGNTFEAYALNFRYMRFTLTFSGSTDGKNLLELSGINIKLSVKNKTDGGNAVCSASDVGGTVVNFNTTFLDVWSITVTPKYGSGAVYGLYDFQDVPNPTSFKILLLDANGNRVSGTASWTARGV